MPSLLEIERALAKSLLAREDSAAAGFVLADGLAPEARLSIYRNTVIEKATAALKLAFPAVQRLVGAEFFAGATAIFIEKEPPRRADLNAYGEGFADFLARFPPAAGLPYLGGLARLEWAIACALHAPDPPALDPERLAGIDPALQGLIAFGPHPAIALVAEDHPVDAIWNAVLAQDEEQMAAVDLDAGPVWLLVERGEGGLAVERLDETAWRFAAALFAGTPLAAAIGAVPEVEAAPLLAEHLAAGRFIGFELGDPGPEFA